LEFVGHETPHPNYRRASLRSGLRGNVLHKAYETAQMTVIKYWYDPELKVTCLPRDVILAELPLRIPVQFRLESITRIHPVLLKLLKGDFGGT
jgi:hypothetical protein